MKQNMGHSPPLWTSSVSSVMQKEETILYLFVRSHKFHITINRGKTNSGDYSCTL